MTIGHIYRSLSLGGMQRGAGAILKVHRDMGHDLVVFTREPVDGNEYRIDVPFTRVVVGGGSYKLRADADRKRMLRAALAAHPCDIVIHHEYYAMSLVDDLEILHEAGVPTLVQWHSCFSSLHMSVWWNGRVCHQLDTVRRYARGVLALSRTDRAFFEMLGVPALHVPYSDPDIFVDVPVHGAGCGREILWPARFSIGKRPIHALRIFERVLEQIPGAHLTMLGDGPERPAVDSYLASRPALAARVSLPGFVSDVVPYFRAADVVLMTTEFEGFCHSIMEAKMAALPIVGYEMDYLDTTRPGTGYVSVPQGDVDAAAAKVCLLLGNDAERRRLGALGRRDFERFAAVDQKNLYRAAFRMALEARTDGAVAVSEPELASNVLNVLLQHVDAHWRNCQAMRSEAEERRRTSLLYRLFTRCARFFAGGCR